MFCFKIFIFSKKLEIIEQIYFLMKITQQGLTLDLRILINK